MDAFVLAWSRGLGQLKEKVHELTTFVWWLIVQATVVIILTVLSAIHFGVLEGVGIFIWLGFMIFVKGRFLGLLLDTKYW